MFYFMKNLNRDPDPAAEAGGAGSEAAAEDLSVGESIANELENQANEGGSETLKPGDEGYVAPELKPGDEGYVAPEDLIDVEGYKGANRRAKGYEGEKRRGADKAAEDPEHEMDFEIEAGKGNHKFKLSELKETAKFLHENKNSLAASLKIRELATKHPEFGKMINAAIEKSFGENETYNGEFVTKTLASLDAKADAVEDKIEDKDEEIEKAEALLNSDDIDPDSVQAQVLKSNIAAMKSTRAQLKQALSKIDEVSKKFGAVEESHKTFISGQEKADEDKEVNRISGIFTKEFDVLTDSKRDNGYKFIDDEDRQDFENKVRNIVASEAGKKDTTIKNDDDFVNLIKNTSNAVYDRISKIREGYVNDYIRSKGGKVSSEGDAPKDTAVSVENMEKQLAALEQEGKKDSPDAVQLRKAIEAEKAKLDDPLGGKTIGETIADAVYADQ